MTELLAVAAGVTFLCIVLLDAFQTIILPRRPAGRFRITRLFFLLTWMPWRWGVKQFNSRRFREQGFSVYGPLSLLMLIVVWAVALIMAFGLIYYGIGAPFNDALHPHSWLGKLRDCLYVSGTTLFTLGLGDVTPSTHLARAAMVAESGVGLAFVALVIGYVPVLYGSFSRREVAVALLDARAGSPPTAGELLVRHAFDGGHEALSLLLEEWERWSAEMLESHVSYPILCYYRSQHDNQSWLAAITAVLDTCALLIATVEGASTRQAQLTFAMARHTLVDLGHVFKRERREEAFRRNPPERLTCDDYGRLCDTLAPSDLKLCGTNQTQERLAALRLLYEPHAQALAEYLCMELPLWTPLVREPGKVDQWKAVAGLKFPGTKQQQHISSQSAAVRLGDDESHPL